MTPTRPGDRRPPPAPGSPRGTSRGERSGRPWLVPPIILGSLLAGVLVWQVAEGGGDGRETADADDAGTAEGDGATTLPPLEPYDGWVDPASSGRPWGDTVAGLLTFRGNPTRSWYGLGPVPTSPRVLWTYPADGTMCGTSTAGGDTSTWCGTGWTGQPAVWERDGRTWVAFGAYDYGVHFVDYQTGADILPPFETGDIIKGTVTVDPDGFPILYTGSRDNYYRAIAFDRSEPTELWRIDAEEVSPTLWNDDWDGSGLVVDDYLFEGGENSQFHIVKLNRGYAADGTVTVDPELVFNTPGWDAQLLDDIGDTQVSIESSVAISGDVVYFANGGGLVQGWDISGLAEGRDPTRVFRYWAGDDVDASIVADGDGFLYVGVEYERGNARAREVGQLVKLDPRAPDDPLVWSVEDLGSGGKSGLWATPAVHGDVVYAATNAGRLLAVDRSSGQILWEKDFASQTWQSPVVVDDVLIQGDCEGNLRAFDVRDPRVDPPELWSVELEGCIESTPTVWKGRVFVGTRDGKMYAVGDQ